MQKTKCHQCGLVNWQGATDCVRCKSSLSGTFSTGLNPFENEPESKKGFSAMKIVVLLVIVGVIGFGAYQVTKPEPPKKVAVPEGQPMVIDSVEVQKVIQEAQKKDAKRIAEMQESFRQAADMKPTFNKDLMQKSAENYARQAQQGR